MKNLLLILIIFSNYAQSEIIDFGAFTHDTNTGLDWMDVTETMGMSYNDVNRHLLNGDEFNGIQFEGWRYATASELDQLIINFGYQAFTTDCEGGVIHCDSNFEGDNPIVENMITTLGDIENVYLDSIHYPLDISPTGAGYLYGFLGECVQQRCKDSRSDEYRTYAVISDREYIYRIDGSVEGDRKDRVLTGGGYKQKKLAQQDMGSFLVRQSEIVIPSPVPVPAAFWLFTSSLLGLVGYKRHNLK